MFLEFLAAIIGFGEGISSKQKKDHREEFVWDDVCDNCGDNYEDCQCLDCDDEECEENW